MRSTACFCRPWVLMWICLWTWTAEARVAVIETESGLTFEGELLLEDDQKVLLLISGIETPVSRSDIKSMTIKKTPEEIYRDRRGALEDDDIDGRFQLAYDMFELRALDLALQETRSVLQQYPDAEKVKRLDAVVVDAIRMEQDRRAAEGRLLPGKTPEPEVLNPERVDGGEAAPADAKSVPLRDQQLDDVAINLVRLWELPTDRDELERLRPKVNIPRKTINALLDDYRDHDGVPRGRREQDRFRRLDGYEQLPLFFEVRARGLYPEIRVIEDPSVMKTFRREIYAGYIQGYFARMFGQGDVEGLTLFGGQGEPTRAAYTDFFILQGFRQDGARMIDRDRPEESLLLHWGLPRDAARFPAPDVPGWRPFFSGRDDKLYQRILDWIDQLYDNPDYGIEYAPPKRSPRPKRRGQPVPEAEPAAAEAVPAP